VITISLKFCGGCNPAYDRTRLSRDIQTALAGRCRFVGRGAAPEADRLVILHGCSTACADDDGEHTAHITHIRSRADAQGFVRMIQEIVEPTA